MIFDDLSQPQSIAENWKFRTGDDSVWAQPDYDDAGWAEIKAPLTWVDQGYPHYVGLAWYQVDLQVNAPPRRHSELAIHLGKIHSAY